LALLVGQKETDGFRVGTAIGAFVGVWVGDNEGFAVGDIVGNFVNVGDVVGFTVG
jgi:hypothetical protein